MAISSHNNRHSNNSKCTWHLADGIPTTFILLFLCCGYITTSVAFANSDNNVSPVVFVWPSEDCQLQIYSPDESFAINTSIPLQESIDIYLRNGDTRVATVIPKVTLKAGASGVTVEVRPVGLGSSTITIDATNFYNSTHQNESDTDLFIRIHVNRSFMVSLLSQSTRWFYTICWAVLLLPQIYLNYQRQSVVGLSFDYLAFSIVSYFAYAVYSMMNCWSEEVKEAYLSDVPLAPGVDRAEVKEVVFSILNLISISVTCFQCYKYERGDQKVSNISKVLIGIIKTILLVLIIIVIAWSESLLSLKAYVDVVVFVKLFVTFSKYVPQVYMNYIRKSTEGWSVAFAILDFLCGVLLLLEMLLVSYNYGNWISFRHSPTRLCVSLFSMTFAVIFITQHFFLYRQIMDEDTIPILSAQDKNKSLQEYGGDDVISSIPEMETVSTVSSRD